MKSTLDLVLTHLTMGVGQKGMNGVPVVEGDRGYRRRVVAVTGGAWPDCLKRAQVQALLLIAVGSLLKSFLRAFAQLRLLIQEV